MNYAEIVAGALAYSDRASDVEVTGNIDVFLRIVESRVNNFLETRDMTSVSYTPILPNVYYYTLPDDFLSERSVALTDNATSVANKTVLTYLIPEQMDVQATQDRGFDAYTIVGNTIQISSANALTDGTRYLQIIYYKRLLPLSTLNTANWLSEKNPQVYIFGLTTEINSFAKDAESTKAWDERFKLELDSIDLQDGKSLWSGNPLQMRLG